MINIQARDEINILSSHAHIDWAAAKSISLSTAGGANITIAGGNITVQCPGKILVQAGKKSFLSPTRINPAMPSFPKGTLVTPLTLNFDHAPAGMYTAWVGMPYKLYANGAMIKQGVLDETGKVNVMHSPAVQNYKVEMANGVIYDVPIVPAYKKSSQGIPANKGFLKHIPGPEAKDTGDTPVAETLRVLYRKAFNR